MGYEWWWRRWLESRGFTFMSVLSCLGYIYTAHIAIYTIHSHFEKFTTGSFGRELLCLPLRFLYCICFGDSMDLAWIGTVQETVEKWRLQDWYSTRILDLICGLGSQRSLPWTRSFGISKDKQGGLLWNRYVANAKWSLTPYPHLSAYT